MAKTVVGLYDSYADAQQAYRDLLAAGFDSKNVSLIANDVARSGIGTETAEPGAASDSAFAEGAGTGALAGGITGLIIGLAALAVPGIGPVLAIGPLAGLVGGAAVGLVIGGILGALIDVGVPEQHAQYYAEGVRRGGSVVTVQTDDQSAERAMDILDRHNAVDVEERANVWRQGGWTGFNASAAPYTADQIAGERARYAQQRQNEPYIPADTMSNTIPTYQAGVPVPPVAVAPASVTQEAQDGMGTIADVPEPSPNPAGRMGRRPIGIYDYSGSGAPAPASQPPMPMDTAPTDRQLVGAKGGEADNSRAGSRPDDYQNSDLGGDVDIFDPLEENP